MKNYMRRAALMALMLLLVWAIPSLGHAQEYRIGQEDVLEISFWQDEALNTTVRVGQDGRITLDIIGQIVAAGRTTEELQTEIIRQMSRLNKNISQAVVRIAQYNFNHVFVTGQVLAPGKRTFETIPSLWSIINEAGGITALGDLTRVTIIRGGEEAGKVEVVNVAKAVAEGNIEQLPKIRRLDTVEIPALPGGVGSAELSGYTGDAKNQVYVIGAVNRPGPVKYEENADCLEVLAMAGGPAATADLSKVKVVTRDGAYSQTYQIDLEEFTKSGKPIRYIVRREDTFIVPHRRGGMSFATIATIIGSASTAVLLIDRLTGTD